LHFSDAFLEGDTAVQDDAPRTVLMKQPESDNGFMFDRTFYMGETRITIKLATNRFELTVETKLTAENQVEERAA